MSDNISATLAAQKANRSASSDETDELWMMVALEHADRASLQGDVPVGCVLVDANGAEVASGCNGREAHNDPTAHAELVAIRTASTVRKSWRLEGLTLYATLEPCVMCAGAIVQSRIGRVVYGCDDPKGGALVSLFSIGQDARLNHRFDVTRGVLSEACAQKLQSFFAKLRAQGKK